MFFKTLLGLIAGLIVVSLAVELPTPKTAFACTGGYGSFEEYAIPASLVAVVEVVSVGGPQNQSPVVTPIAYPPGLVPPQTSTATPTRTPSASATLGAFASAPTNTPSPAATPTPTVTSVDPSASRQLPFDLTGIGARVRITNPIAGDDSGLVDVDNGIRRGAEQNIRRIEANPTFILPCPPGFLVTRYTVGQRLLLFAGRENNELYTMVALPVTPPLEGDEVLFSTENGDGLNYALTVSTALRQTVFAEFPAENSLTQGLTQLPTDRWFVKSRRVPLGTVIRGIVSLRLSAPGSPLRINHDLDTPIEFRTPQIRPPNTGDAGLRGLPG